MDWLDVFKHLLPNARAWRITVEKRLREFFQGLTGVAFDVKAFYDGVYSDLDPQQTRELAKWEIQFGLRNAGLTEQERRDRVSAAWKALGGQSPRYIQDTLQAAGFSVYVHEWWEPIVGRSGGSMGGDVSPIARNPFTYLWDGVAPRQFTGSGHNSAFAGSSLAFAGSQNSPAGYPLVNKILKVTSAPIGAGSITAVVGGLAASVGADVMNSSLKQYAIPTDSTKYPFFLYIGAENFPDLATVPLARRDEFEDLCLKIRPTEQWLGVLVSFS